MTTSTATQMSYLFKRVTPRVGQEGLWDAASGENYRQVIESYAVVGWRFVQAIPAGGGLADEAAGGVVFVGVAIEHVVGAADDGVLGWGGRGMVGGNDGLEHFLDLFQSLRSSSKLFESLRISSALFDSLRISSILFRSRQLSSDLVNSLQIS